MKFYCDPKTELKVMLDAMKKEKETLEDDLKELRLKINEYEEAINLLDIYEGGKTGCK